MPNTPPPPRKKADQVRVFEHGALRLIYETTFRAGRPLVVVFSGVDATPARCLTSYYGLHWQLDASVVHIHDPFGSHGNYLLQSNQDPQIRNAVRALLRDLLVQADVKPKDMWLVGSSKGGTSALCMAVLLKGANCIAVEPQIRLGDFFFPDNRDWRNLGDLQGLAYAMMGRVDPADREALNQIVPNLLERGLPSYRGQAQIVYGRTQYYDKHIRYVEQAVAQANAGPNAPAKKLNVRLRKEPFRRHTDCGAVFTDYMFRQFGPLPGVIPPPGAPTVAAQREKAQG